MSDRNTTILILAIACAAFIGLGAVFDRDILLFPLQKGAKGQERERAKVLETIRTYNAIATDLYVTNGVPKLLDELPATKAVRHELFRDIGFIRDFGRVLVYDLATITPVDIRINSQNAAEAVVFEEWNYVYQRKDSRELVSRIKGLGQGFKYRLVKERGTWKVSAWDPMDVAEPLNKGK